MGKRGILLMLLPFILFIFAMLIVSVTSSTCLERERSSLLAFKDAIINNNSQYLNDGFLESWSNTSTFDCCLWEGVSCSRFGEVVSLNISQFYWTGSSYEWASNVSLNAWGGLVPPELCALTNLTSLFLVGIGITSPLPKCFFTNLSNLRELDLSFNDLKGPIPHELGALKHLQVLRLSSNNMNGSVPPQICSLTNLSSLFLGGDVNLISGDVTLVSGDVNLISGPLPKCFSQNLSSLRKLELHMTNFSESILDHVCALKHLQFLRLEGQFKSLPYCIGKLSHLSTLSVSFNLITGPMPSFLGQLSNLTTLDITDNNFIGPLPPNIAQLTHLVHLDVSNNQLNGQFPNIAQLTHLVHLDVSYNQLNGQFPNIAQLTHLVHLDVSNNQLNGQFPNIAQLTHLVHLDVSNNQLNGQFPNIAQLTHLVHLDVSSNQLNGQFPNIAQLTHLVHLDVSNNQLHGQLPLYLSQLSQLEYLGLGGNHFSGSIPASLGSLPNMKELYLDSNYFSGPIPEELGNLKNLEILSLGGNSEKVSMGGLTGSIPKTFGNLSNLFGLFIDGAKSLRGAILEELGNLPDLMYLRVRNTGIRGPVPATLANLSCLDLSSNSKLIGKTIEKILPLSFANRTNLQFLNLSNNHITGSIPIFLLKMWSINTLDLSNNCLEGSIPKYIGGLYNLQAMSLRNNRLTGKIPISLGNCSHLNQLDLGFNKLEGSLEKSGLSNLFNLRELLLGSNCFEGSIPHWLSNFSDSIQIIDLSHNHFTGFIPTTLQLPSFRHPQLGFEYLSIHVELTEKAIDLEYQEIPYALFSLDLSGNKLNGSIPSELGDLSGIKSLNLSRNELSGGIPGSFAKLSQLESLDLSYNRLEGRIPPELSNLTELEVFNVSYNERLYGPLPSNYQFLTFFNSSYYGDDKLCGKPILRDCVYVHNEGGLGAINGKKPSRLKRIIHYIKEALPGFFLGYGVSYICFTIFFILWKPARQFFFY